jgi:glycerol-3-phosphate dehydrogenase
VEQGEQHALGGERAGIHNHAPLEALERLPGGGVRATVSGVGIVEARAMLRCTGVAGNERPPLLAMNLIVDALPLGSAGEAVGLTHPDDRRNVFVVPWRGRSMIGTYYRDYPGPAHEPLRFERAWLDEFLAWLAPVHPQLALAAAQVRFVHAGLLPRGDADPSSPADRERIEPGAHGELRVETPKWTTAYGVAQRAVERVIATLGTRATPLTDERAPLLDVGTEIAAHRAHDAALDEPLAPGVRATRRALAFALEREWARTLEDVLLRRTGLASAGHPGRTVVDAASAALQRYFDWSERERSEQVERFDASFHFAGNVA